MTVFGSDVAGQDPIVGVSDIGKRGIDRNEVQLLSHQGKEC